jgi:hypothetical protein
MENYYFISAIATIIQSDLIIIAQDTFLKVYDANTVMDAALYVYEFEGGISSIEYSYLTNEIFASGYKFAAKLSITAPALAECHPNCSGGCSIAFSPNACTSCMAPSAATMVSTESVCLTTASPPDAITDFATASWSTPNQTPKDGKMGFFEEIMSKYKKEVYIGGGILAFCLLYCICRSCCSSEGEDEPEPEKKKPKRKYTNRVHDVSHSQVYPATMY